MPQETGSRFDGSQNEANDLTQALREQGKAKRQQLSEEAKKFLEKIKTVKTQELEEARQLLEEILDYYEDLIETMKQERLSYQEISKVGEEASFVIEQLKEKFIGQKHHNNIIFTSYEERIRRVTHPPAPKTKRPLRLT